MDKLQLHQEEGQKLVRVNEDKLPLNLKEIQISIKQGLEQYQMVNPLKDHDVILFIGPAGCGKSTITDWLSGTRIVKKIVKRQFYLDRFGFIEYEVEVIGSEGNFNNRRSAMSRSETRFKYPIQKPYQHLLMVDTLGFEQKRSVRIDISQTVILNDIIKNSQNIRLVYLIDYGDLVAYRGKILKENILYTSRILQKPENESIQKIIFLFTNVPENKSIQAIRNEVIRLYLSIQYEEESIERKIAMTFLQVILVQLKGNNIIVTPTDSEYKDLLEKILNQNPFTNPQQEIHFNISAQSNHKVELEVNKLSEDLSQQWKKGQFQEAMQTLINLQILKECVDNDYLEEAYHNCQSQIINEVQKKVTSVLYAFIQDSKCSDIISQHNIEKIKSTISCLKIVDQFKDGLLDEYYYSEKSFINEIERVWSDICKQMTSDFHENIGKAKISLLKLKDFSEQSTLGIDKYKEMLENFNQLCLKEFEKLKIITDSIYQREDNNQHAEIELKNQIHICADILEMLKYCDEFLEKSIRNDRELNYEQIINQIQNKNKEFEAMITNSIKQLKNYQSIYDQQIVEKSLDQDMLMENVKNKFNTEVRALSIALEDCDFQRTVYIIKSLKKSILISQVFKQNYVDLISLYKKIENKINMTTLEAQNIIRKSIVYDDNLNDLVNKIYQADQEFQNLEEIRIPSKMDIIMNELNAKLDLEVKEIINLCSSNHEEDLQSISNRIINMKHISDSVHRFSLSVEKKLFEAINKIKQIQGDNYLFKLGNILKKDLTGAILVKQIIYFSNINLEKWKELFLNYDIKEILEKLTIFQEKEELLSPLVKQILSKFYKIIKAKYRCTIISYKQQKDKLFEIVDKVKSLSQTMTLSTTLSEKNDIYEKNLLNLIALIFAYWKLTVSGEQSVENDICIVLNPTQILSVILLLGIHEKDRSIIGVPKDDSLNLFTNMNNKLLRYGMREGKSLVLGILSILLSLKGYNVHVIYQSSLVSFRDYQSFRQIFISFGVSSRINYGTFQEIIQKEQEPIKHDIKEGSKNIKGVCKSQNKKILLINEVDEFFSEVFFSRDNYVPSFSASDVSSIITDIWNLRGEKCEKIIENIMNSAKYASLIVKHFPSREYLNKQIIQMCEAVQQTEQHQKYHKYKVKNNQIIYSEENDSSQSFSLNYGYHTMFAYLNQNKLGNIDDNTLQSKLTFSNSKSISNKTLLNSYAAIIGVNTALKQKNEMKRILKKYYFSSEISLTSTFQREQNSQLNYDHKIFIEENKEKQHKRIQDIAIKAIENQKSVIIFFQDEQSLDQQYHSNQTTIPKEKIICVKESYSLLDVEFYVQRLTQTSSILLLQKSQWKGTDFKIQEQIIKESGDVTVIQTFFSQTDTENIQIKRQTARQGSNGKYYLILNQNDLESDFQVTSELVDQWNKSQISLYQSLISYRDQKQKQQLVKIEQRVLEEMEGQKKIGQDLTNL